MKRLWRLRAHTPQPLTSSYMAKRGKSIEEVVLQRKYEQGNLSPPNSHRTSIFSPVRNPPKHLLSPLKPMTGKQSADKQAMESLLEHTQSLQIRNKVRATILSSSLMFSGA
jgi:hypothetical protein